MNTAPQTIPVYVRNGANKLEADAFLAEDHIELLNIDRSATWLGEWFWLETAGSSRKIKVQAKHDGAVLYDHYATLFSLQNRDNKQIAILLTDAYRGTDAVKMWRANSSEEPVWEIDESYIYSDIRFHGELLNMGPFSILNTAPDLEPPHAALVLRSRTYVSLNVMRTTHPHDKKTPLADERQSSRHVDEIAALLSTLTGARLLGGRTIRRIGPQFRDEFGRPEYPGRPPYLPFRTPTILPTYQQWVQQGLNTISEDFLRYFRLPLREGSAFSRACRLFQKAVWYCDDDVETAWLRLVGACETLAAHEAETVVDNERDALPEFLRSETMSEAVLQYLKKLSGSTRKFLSFLNEYAPPPPLCRPTHSYAKLDWNDLQAAYSSIYLLRSDALHSGHALPTPMVWPPEREHGVADCGTCGNAHYFERMVGKKGFGTTWFEPKSCPMHFHIFLYIVRGALVNWLRRKAPAPVEPAEADLEPTATDVPRALVGDAPSPTEATPTPAADAPSPSAPPFAEAAPASAADAPSPSPTDGPAPTKPLL